jgi:hypothetical protein
VTLDFWKKEEEHCGATITVRRTVPHLSPYHVTYGIPSSRTSCHRPQGGREKRRKKKKKILSEARLN